MKQLNKKLTRLVMLVSMVLIGQASLFAQLNGTYTVYGSGANYSTLQAAASALSAGVSGPVTFKIRSGTWTDANTVIATIGNIAGASATNTITFEAENGNAATTVLVNSSTSSTTTLNNIFYLDGAKYIRVRNLTLNKSHATYGTCVRFNGDADYNIVENCILTGTVNTSTSNTMSRVFGTGIGAANDNIIRNNTINGGSYGVYWYGSSTSSRSTNNEFSGNTLISPYAYGFYTYYTTNNKILNNTITRTGAGTFYGFYMYYGNGGYKIEGNSYTGTSITGANYPIYMYYCDGDISNRGSISNNTINVTSTTTLYGATMYYGNYYSFANNNMTLSNTTTLYPIYNYNYNSSTAFTYGKQCYINNNVINATSTTTVYIYGHYYYQQDCQFNNNNITINSGAGTQYIYAGYYYQYGLQMNGNTINMIGTTGTKYLYAGYYYGENGFEFNNNVVNVSTTTGTSYVYVGYYTYYNQQPVHYNNNSITMTATSTAALYNYFGYYNYNSLATGNEIKGNQVNMTTTGTAAYNYMGYYFNGLDLSDNTVYVKSASAAYGIYSYGNSSGTNPWTVKNNKVTAIGGASTVYGFYNYYASNATIANNVIYASGSSTCYGYIGGYNSGGGNFYNNTVHTEGTSTHYTFYCYESSGSQFATVRNNVFSRSSTGSGYLQYGYQPQFYDMDYNNYWANGGTMLYWGGLGTTYTTVTSMRTGMNQNMNSLSYNPGFYSTSTSAPDLRPNPANANSWSLNGRGVQLSGNDKDINGNARALTTVAGVPDLGAYEFTPTATPPNCTMAPAAPVANGTQVVTFGEDTVAVLKWGNTVPTGFSVKQYTGTNPPGITSINPTQMFYYADFQGTGSNSGCEQSLYFKDPWLGTIASKSALRLAEKVGSNSWVGYAPSTSSSNVVRNFILTPTVQTVSALFTGIDVSDNASADAIIDPVPPFCPGTYTVRLRIKNNGNNKINNVKIDWQINGGAITTINYTTPIDINGSSAGNTAIITLAPIAFGNSAVNIKAWTYLPNGVQDPIPGDDTLNQDYFAALSGTYTVGGTTPDFPNVVAAANALNQYGTCGDVIFNVRPGIYTGQVVLKNAVSASNTTDHVTFQSTNSDPTTTQISYSATGSGDMPTLFMNGASNFTIRNLGIVAAGGSYGTGIEFQNKASYDSILGCRVIVSTTASSNFRCVWNSGQSDCNYNTFKDCSLEGGYYGIYWYTTSAPYSKGLTVDNCTMNPYYYGTYIYYSNELTARNNTIIARQPGTSYYGLMAYMYNPNNPNKTSDIYGNKVIGFYGYSMYLYYVDGTTSKRSRVMNNAVITADNTTCYYPMLLYYPSNCDIYNNTLINNGGSSTSYYGAYIYLSTYPNNKIYNNVFANRAGGYAASVTFSSGYGTEMDYNDLYSSSTTQMMTGNSTAADLAAWRTGSGLDAHSVSYDPPFISSTNPAPLTTNPGVWALNGHGVHITGNNKDINGNPRIEKRVDGAPDLGAYEIIPEVAPPAATANPATADPGDTQVFTFAGNEVGRITWGLTAPSTAVTVRQYSGEKGNGIAAAASPMGSMYFHTDVAPVGNGTTFDFDFNLDYMDIWLGDISAENNLRLAHRVNGYPWMVYSGSLSTVDTTTDNIDASKLNRFGSYTALENGSIASAFVRAQGSVVICIGNSVVLNAEPQDGDYYKWYRNKVAISGAEGPNAKTYLATQPGDYSVVITFSGKSVESVPLTVTTIAPPNALINANGPLTYCTGNGLTLNAGNTTGVTYQWQLNGNNIPGATNNTFPVSQAGNYTVVVTNIGCSSTSTQTTVSSGPIVVDLGRDTSYCEIKNVWMKLDAGYPGAKYLWNTGDTTRTIEVKKGGKYTVQVDGGPNCVGQDDIQVTIDPLPKANGISFVQNGNTYQFFPSGPVGAVGFLWIFSDGSVSTQTNPTKTISGDLYVRLVMFNACGSDTVQLGWPLSVQNVVGEDELSIYPNPAKDQITVRLPQTAIETVEVVNSVGSVVYKTTVNGNEHRIDISCLANGHYMLRAITDSGTITKQFDVLK
ncbi:MAG: right-handed parallel beta-helix repeat-containing protein [Chitinophagales bacterium]|nr:right-handed parallel beta-helix repeat-containing protein [Chitinophagales bacterium]